jgi:uncharacterized protein
VTVTPRGVSIHIRLTPKSRVTRVQGVEAHGEKLFLKVQVAAPPEDGKANAAMIAAVAAWLGMPKSELVLESGQKSRLKTVSVFAPAEAVLSKLAARLASDVSGPQQQL